MADFKGFLGKDTAGLPNWAWLLVVGAGLAAAYIVPKILAGKSSNSSSTPTTGTGTGTSGLGLAIDPTNGLPYAVEGLVPSGAYAGTPNPPPVPTPTPTPTPTCKDGYHFVSGAIQTPIPTGAYAVSGGYCVPDKAPGPGPGPGGVAGQDYPLVPFGTQGIPNFSNLKPGTYWTWNNVKYQLVAGPLGHLYGIDPSGHQVMLYAPASFYPGGSNYKGPPTGQPGGGPVAPVQVYPVWPGGVRQIRISPNGSGY